MVERAKELLWMTIFLKELGKFHLNIIKLLCDNRANTKLGHINPIFNSHVTCGISLHYVHMKIFVNEMEMGYIFV
jgi:hypothetical protein